jgi:hypothetical protein
MPCRVSRLRPSSSCLKGATIIGTHLPTSVLTPKSAHKIEQPTPIFRQLFSSIRRA